MPSATRGCGRSSRRSHCRASSADCSISSRRRITASAASGLARTVLLCLLVVAVFYALITKPLLKITGAIATVSSVMMPVVP